MCQTAHNAGSVAGIAVPNSRLARDVREFVRDTSTELLFNHSSRVYYFAALRGEKLGLRCDPDLLYTGAMFHDLGLLASHSSDADRFEVDGANAARAFLRARGISEEDANNVWLAIALHTTPGIPCHMHPLVALVTEGVEMDVLGLTYKQFSARDREAVVEAFPRSADFKNDIIQAFYEGIRHKPNTTFGNVKADVLARKDKQFVRQDFCCTILNSAWPA